ncbi:MAG: 3-oxoacyl-[acyl-carrier-protein] reductase FabG [Promethearchaeota archaeon]|nr:MAG: 3-oxoacyl-[acyl-carrier-protein] reductase FabG [Candidatus Lokiarchaeota archaeon]
MNKNVLVTGSGSGIGQSIAIRLAKEGHNIILNGRTQNKLLETNKILEKYKVRTIIKSGDISKSNFVEQLIAEIRDEWEYLHVVINNAGISGKPSHIINISEEEFQTIIDINFKGTWLVSKFAAKIMKRQRKLNPLRGKLINISSIAGREPMPMEGIYSASKAAVISLTKGLAKELAPDITANVVCPGYHITPMYQDDPQLIKNYWNSINMIPALNKVGTAEDVANVVSFLVSEDSNYITGQVIGVCGGVII